MSVCIHCAMCSYLGDRNRGHFDTLLEQHTQYAVLLLQVKHTGPQLHTFLFQVLETPQEEKNGQITATDGIFQRTTRVSDANLRGTGHNAVFMQDAHDSALKHGLLC